MNINAVSFATPKLQSTNSAKNVNFTGLERAAQTAGEAATAAANKAGITDKLVKVASIIIDGLKKLGQNLLQNFKKLVFGPHDINIGKNNKVNYTVNGKRVTAKEFDSAFEGFGTGAGTGISTGSNVVITQSVGKGGFGINHTSQRLASGEKFSITQIGGKTYINGKLYKPGDKLPEGITFKDGAFCVDKGNGKKVTITQTSGEA